MTGLLHDHELADAVQRRLRDHAAADGHLEVQRCAKILRIYEREPVLGLLKSTILEMTANAMWLVREIEVEWRELLIEQGKWLD